MQAVLREIDEFGKIEEHHTVFHANESIMELTDSQLLDFAFHMVQLAREAKQGKIGNYFKLEFVTQSIED